MDRHLSNLDLNNIRFQRASLTFSEAVGVWLMHFSGEKQQTIANRFGTNMGRIADVLKERKHEGARTEAIKLSRS